MGSTQHANCRSCCAKCLSHFATDEAFDAHRQGDHAAGTRHCVDPEDVLDSKGRPKLAVKDEEGICRISGTEEPRRGVQVWTMAKNLEKQHPHATPAGR